LRKLIQFGTLLLEVFLPLIITLLIIELLNFPKKVYLVIIYLLKIEGIIAEGNSFSGLEKTINENDWITARYFGRRSFLDRDFSPEPNDLITLNILESLKNRFSNLS
jgi:hypothetical protein